MVRRHFAELSCSYCNFKDNFPKLTNNFTKFVGKINLRILYQNQTLQLFLKIYILFVKNGQLISRFQHISTLQNVKFRLYVKNCVACCLFCRLTWFISKLKKWGRMARKCLEMLFMTSTGKFKLPWINWHSKHRNIIIVMSWNSSDMAVDADMAITERVGSYKMNAFGLHCRRRAITGKV